MGLFGSIIGVIKGGISGILGGGPVGAVVGGVSGLIRSGASVVPGKCNVGFMMSNGVCVSSFPGRGITTMPVVGRTGCPPGTVWDPTLGACFSPKSPAGGRALADQFGEAVVGRFGAALVPGNRVTNVAICPRGSVLGLDGLCYNKRDISNKERMWPRGRRPLLTGGEMRAINIAASAAKKITRKTKQLQSLGMMKRLPARRAPRQIAGHHEHLAHD